MSDDKLSKLLDLGLDDNEATERMATKLSNGDIAAIAKAFEELKIDTIIGVARRLLKMRRNERNGWIETHGADIVEAKPL